MTMDDLEAPTTNALSGRPQWMAGRCEEEYIREGDVWKLASIKTHWFLIAPYEEGLRENAGDVRARAIAK